MLHVAMAQHICGICGSVHEHNTEVLIPKRLKDIPDDKRITGYGLCEEHDKLFKDGYIALIGANAPEGTDTLKNEEADRTGDLVYLKREVFKYIFGTEISDGLPMVFVDPEVIQILKDKSNE